MSSKQLARMFLAFVATAISAGCSQQKDLGAPDAFVFFEPVTDADGRQALDASGLPLLRHVPPADRRAAIVAAVLERDVAAHALALERWAKREVRESKMLERGYGTAAKDEAGEPTVWVLVGEPEDAVLFRVGIGFAIESWSGGRTSGAAFIEVGSEPEEDTALAQTVSGRLATLAAIRIASLDGLATRRPGPHALVAEGEDGALVEGFGMALEAMARDAIEIAGRHEAGTAAQQQRAASVRHNGFVFADGDTHGVRHASDLLADPGMTGALLYRLARAPGSDRPDPSRLAKWLLAWSSAIREGRPPRDAADLIDAYARLFPVERDTAVRTFVSSTLGATVQPGGVDATPSLEWAAPALDALAGRVLAGELPLKAALATR